MSTEHPELTPFCCSKLAKWVVHGPSLAYFYCGECKNEVLPISVSEKEPSLFGLEVPDPQGFWATPIQWLADPGGFLPTGNQPKLPTIKEDDEDPHIYTKAPPVYGKPAIDVLRGLYRDNGNYKFLPLPPICQPKNKDVK